MSIKVIEDALIAEIQAALGNKVRSISSLPGDWDAEMFKRLMALVPGVFVVFAGGAPTAFGGTAPFINAHWVVIAATGHASGEAARRRGDGSWIGAYEILETLVPRLHGFTVPDEGSLALVDVANLYNGAIDKQGLAVYAATFQMPMALATVADLATLDAFTTFDAQYDVPPFSSAAEHAKWLAGDYSTSNPDGEDKATLP